MNGNVRRGVIYAVLVFACFSTGDALVKWLTTGYSIFQLTFVSYLFAVIPIGALVARTGGWASLRPRHPGWVIVRSLMLATEGLLCYYAFSRMPLAEVYPLIFVTPILVTLLAVPLLGERVGWRRMTAVVVGFLGVVIVLRPGFRVLDAGHAAALASTLCFSLSILILGRLRNENYGALLVTLVAVKIVIGAALMLPFGGFTPMAPTDIVLVAAVGILGGLAHVFLVLAVRDAPASLVSPFQYSQMLWAIFYGAVVFGDWPDGVTLVGAAVIIGAGMFIMERTKKVRQEEPARP